ncbi:hypothetical protein [Streptomyces hypolithicus]
MSSLVGKIILIVVLFVAFLLIFGAQVGQIELAIWGAALVASITVAARMHKRQNASS